MSRSELPELDWSGRYLQNDDGTWAMVDDDGFIVDLPSIYKVPDFGMYDKALPQRPPFVGPPAAYNGAPADVVERIADAVREWAEN